MCRQSRRGGMRVFGVLRVLCQKRGGLRFSDLRFIPVRGINLERDRVQQGTSAPLKQRYFETAFVGAQLQAQRRRRRSRSGAWRTQYEDQRLITTGKQMQAPQRAKISIGMPNRQPANQCAQMRHAQRLFQRPQTFTRRSRLHEDRTIELDSCCGQSGRIRKRCIAVGAICEHASEGLRIWQRPDARASCFGCMRQSWHEQRQFALPGRFDKKLGQCTLLPAAARQLGIERRITAGDVASGCCSEYIVGTPDVSCRSVVKKGSKSRGGTHDAVARGASPNAAR